MFSENEEVTSISFYPREFHPTGIPYFDDSLVEWTGPYTPANFTEMDLMRYLAHHINADRFRWKEIELSFSFGGPLRHRVGSTDNSQGRFVTFGPFPRIERLLLTAPTDCFPVLQSRLDLSDSHQLRTLSLLGNWHFYDSLRAIAPNGTPALPSLNTLELVLVGDTEAFSSLTQCMRLLENAPNVQTLTVCAMPASGSTAPPAQLLRLEGLRYLCVVAAAGQLGTIVNFLNRIQCPRLQQLVVLTVNEDNDEHVSRFMLELQDLLRRSKCTLEVLKIQSRLIPENSIIELLFCVPDLRSLMLSGCDDLSERMLSTLSVRGPGNRGCLDKLRKIVFDRCTFASKDGYSVEEFADGMIKMMWSRLSSRVSHGLGEGLEVVVSECGIEFDVGMLEQLELMEEQGLRFSTEHPFWLLNLMMWTRFGAVSPLTDCCTTEYKLHLLKLSMKSVNSKYYSQLRNLYMSDFTVPIIQP